VKFLVLANLIEPKNFKEFLLDIANIDVVFFNEPFEPNFTFNKSILIDGKPTEEELLKVLGEKLDLKSYDGFFMGNGAVMVPFPL